MKDFNDWNEVKDVTGVTVYCKEINGYNREVYFNPVIHQWCFKKWTNKSSFPIVGSARTFNEAIKECEKTE